MTLGARRCEVEISIGTSRDVLRPEARSRDRQCRDPTGRRIELLDGVGGGIGEVQVAVGTSRDVAAGTEAGGWDGKVCKGAGCRVVLPNFARDARGVIEVSARARRDPERSAVGRGYRELTDYRRAQLPQFQRLEHRPPRSVRSRIGSVGRRSPRLLSSPTFTPSRHEPHSPRAVRVPQSLEDVSGRLLLLWGLDARKVHPRS